MVDRAVAEPSPDGAQGSQGHAQGSGGTADAGRSPVAGALRQVSFREGQQMLRPGGPAGASDHGLGEMAQQAGRPGDVVMAYQGLEVAPDVVPESSGGAVAELVEAGQEIAGRKRLKKKDRAELGGEDLAADAEAIRGEGGALGYLAFELGGAAPEVQAQVVAALDGDGTFSELLKRAGYERLWATPEIAGAVIGLLQLRERSAAVADVKQLLLVKPFDWQVNRYEARLAWELLQTLDPADRDALLAGVPPSAANPEATEEEKLADAPEGGVPVAADKPVRPQKPPKSLKKNDPEAYADAMAIYEMELATFKEDKKGWKGDEKDREAVEKVEKKAEKQELRELRKDDPAAFKERKQEERLAKRVGGGAVDVNLSDEYKASSRYDTYQGDEHQAEAPDGALAVEASDREALLTQVMDPALWEGDEARLRGVLKMVVQADEAAFVAPYVSEHWGRHQNLFMGLGFDESGRFLEHITDDTATTALRRGLAAIGVIGDVLGLVLGGAFGGTKSRYAVDLKQAETAFLGKYGGLHLADAAAGDLTGVLVCLLGSQQIVDETLALTRWSEDHLLETLLKGTAARDEIEAAVSEVRAPGEEGEQASSGEGGGAALAEANQLVFSSDDKKGEMCVEVPLLAVAGQQLRLGERTIKMGPGALVGAKLTIKNATARDGARSLTVEVAQVRLSEVTLIEPEGMSMIGLVELGELRLKAAASDAKPATLLGQIASDVQVAVMQVLQVVPVVRFADQIEDVVKAAKTGGALASDLEGVEIAFAGLTVSGIVTSAGDHVDQVSVGATELWIKPDLPTTYDWRDLQALDKVRDKHTKKRDRLRRVTERKEGKDSALAQNQREQLAWLEEEVPKIDRAIALHEELWPVEQDLLEKRRQRMELAQEQGDEVSDEAAAQLAALDAEIAALEGQIGDATEVGVGIEAGSKLGRTEVSGLDWAGVQIGSMTMEEVHFEGGMVAGDAEGEQVGGVRGATDGIVLQDVSYGGGIRRDLQIVEEIAAIRAAAKEDDARELSKDEVKAIALLEEELAFLGPFVDEYVVLRGRLTDHERPMTGEERQRYGDLVERLASKPSVTVGEIRATDVELTAEVGDVDAASDGDLTSLAGGVSAGELVISDLGLHETSELSSGGSTTVDEIRVTDASLDLDATSGEGLLSIDVAGIDVAGVHMEGTGAVVAGQLEAAQAELGDAELRLAALESIPAEERTEEDDARLEALRAQVAALDTRLHGDDVTEDLAAVEAELATLKQIPERDRKKSEWARIEELTAVRAELLAKSRGLAGQSDVQEALEVLVTELDATFATLVGADGIDRSRGYSLAAARDTILGTKAAIGELRHGKTGGSDPYEVCVDNADRLITTYTDGIARVKARGASQEGTRDAAKLATKGDDAGLGEESDLAFAERDLSETVGTIDAAKAELAKWEQHRADLGLQVLRAQELIAAHERYAGQYAEIVSRATTAGVDWTAAGLSGVEDLSAFMIQQLAVGQLDGWKSMSIDAIHVSEVHVDVSGFVSMLSGDEDAPTPEMMVSGGKDEGGQRQAMVGGVTVEGVKLGDEVMVETLSLDQIDANITMLTSDLYQVDGLSIANVTLGGVDWQSPDYALRAPGDLTLEGVEVSALIHVVGEETRGVVDSFSIDRITSEAMEVRYGDYLISMGSLALGEAAQGEAAAVQAVSLSNYDLETGAMDVALGGLTTTDLQADLGAGMVIGARNLSADSMSIGSVVSAAEKDRAEARGEGDQGEAAAYSIDLAGLDADDLTVGMEGLAMSITTLRDGSLRGFEIDQHTGAFSFDEMAAPTLLLGPMAYVTPDMSFFIQSGLDLMGVKVAGHGKMLFDEAEEQAAREESPTRVPEFIQELTLSLVHADSADLRQVDYTAVAGAGATTKAHIDRATARDLNITDYVLYMEANKALEGTMKVNVEDATIDGLSAALTDQFGSTRMSGSFQVDSLAYSSLVDDQGRPLTEVAFSGAESTGDVTLDQSAAGTDYKDRETTSATSMTLTDLSEASGSLKMTSDLAGEGDMMSFSELSLGHVALGSLSWRGTGAGSVTSVAGNGVGLTDVKASGYTVTRMVERDGMPLPETDVHLSELGIELIEAEALHVVLGTEAEGQRGETTIDLGVGTVPYRAAVISGVSLVGLEYVGGKLKDGRLDIGTVNGGVDVQSRNTAVKDNLTSLLTLASTVDAQGIWAEFSQDGDKIDAGVGSLALEDVELRYDMEDGSWVVLSLPSAVAKGLDVDLTSSNPDDPDVIAQALGLHVPELDILSDADFSYYAAPAPYEPEGEKTAGELRDEMEASEGLYAGLTGVDWHKLLDHLGGTVDLTVGLDGPSFLDLDVPLSVRVTDGDIRLASYIGELNAAVRAAAPFPGSLMPGIEVFKLETYVPEGGGAARMRIRVGPDINPLSWTSEREDPVAVEVADIAEWGIGFADPAAGPEELEDKIAAAGGDEAYDAGASHREDVRGDEISVLRARIPEFYRAQARYEADYGKKSPVIARQIEQDEARLKELRSGPEADAWVNVNLKDLDAHLALGKTTGVQVASGAHVGWEEVGLDFVEAPKGVYEAGVHLLGLTFAMGKTEEGQSQLTSVQVGEADVTAKLDRLFPGGNIQVYGDDAFAMCNPIRGTVQAPATAKDFRLTMASLQTRRKG